MINRYTMPFTRDEVDRLIRQALIEGTDVFVGHFHSSGKYYNLKRQDLPKLLDEIKVFEIFNESYKLGLLPEGCTFPVSTLVKK